MKAFCRVLRGLQAIFIVYSDYRNKNKQSILIVFIFEVWYLVFSIVKQK